MSKVKGIIGECMAQKYLSNKGFKVLDMNYHSRYGEVDIVALKGDCFVFVEVKLRKKNSKIFGREAVDRRKQTKMAKTALVYLSEIKKEVNARFDVVEVTCSDDSASTNSIVHLENAFSLDDFYLGAA